MYQARVDDVKKGNKANFNSRIHGIIMLKILDLGNIWENEREDGTLEDYISGATIVFGEEDAFDVRYVKIVSLEEFGLSEEEAFDVAGGHLHAKKHLLDLEKLSSDAHRVICKDVYPNFDPSRYTEFDESSCDVPFFEKSQRLALLHEDDTWKYEYMKHHITVEIKAGEILKRSRHPNVAAYLGCKVEHNLVTGLYYEHIKTWIYHVSKPLKVEKYIDDIRNGIQHIHSMGLCHNDIHPENIRMREDDTAVIIDFDACLPVGKELLKRAPGRFGQASTISEPKNDWFALDAVEQWMHEQNEKYLADEQAV